MVCWPWWFVLEFTWSDFTRDVEFKAETNGVSGCDTISSLSDFASIW